jgi:lipoprotein-anchoring transpeptidase ErfK/SrfK
VRLSRPFYAGHHRLNGRCISAASKYLPLAALFLAAVTMFGPTLAVAGEVVAFTGGYAPGTIVVQTSQRRLYLVLEHGQAIRYVVGVGRAGRQWSGASNIEAKYLRPNWAPPEAVRRDNPSLPDLIASGAPNNPMGAAAMTLAGGEYAIHGTNAPETIGGFVSYGCIRMFNPDILDLYARVNVGTRVVVTR